MRFWSVLALSLALLLTPVFSSAQIQQKQKGNFTADACVQLGNVFLGVFMRKDQGQTIEKEISGMREAVAADPNASVLIPFYTQKITEIYQTKQDAVEFSQKFVIQCFQVRGSIEDLSAKHI